ncbi:MAG: hypothetical protein ACYC8T_21155 [Myxococcaceae bacterium]
MMTDRRTGLALAAALLTACSSDPSASARGAWRKSGLEVGEFHDAADRLKGSRCSAGRVAGLDVTVCEFPDAAAAARAESSGYELLDGATGLSLASGRSLLVVADWTGVDPDGRKLNEVALAFRR